VQSHAPPHLLSVEYLESAIYVDGPNNPKIPVGEIHSTKTFSPKNQLDLPKAEQVLSLFLSSSKDTSKRTPTVKQGQAKSLLPFLKNKPLVKPKRQSLPLIFTESRHFSKAFLTNNSLIFLC